MVALVGAVVLCYGNVAKKSLDDAKTCRITQKSVTSKLINKYIIVWLTNASFHTMLPRDLATVLSGGATGGTLD